MALSKLPPIKTLIESIGLGSRIVLQRNPIFKETARFSKIGSTRPSNYNLQENKTNPKPGDTLNTSSSVSGEKSPDSSDQPLSKKAKLKQAVKDYGSTVLVFHITMSLCSLGIVYLLVSSGLDMVGLLAKIGVGEQVLQTGIAQGASTFVIAYAVHKIFAPVRITITLTATPLIVRKLRSMGILKKPINK